MTERRDRIVSFRVANTSDRLLKVRIAADFPPFWKRRSGDHAGDSPASAE